MRKTRLHFEIVPVEVAEKILEKQNSKDERNGDGKKGAGKSTKAPNGAHRIPRKVEILIQ